MKTLKPTQSHVEPLIASIQSFKIAFSLDPSKYRPIISCELIIDNWLVTGDRDKVRTFKYQFTIDHLLRLELQPFGRLPYNPPFLLKGKKNA